LSAGRIYGLLGPNGAGKTTLIRLLTGMARPTSGTAEVLGVAMPSRANLARIGYMTQSDGVYPSLTALENVRFFGALYGVPAEADALRALEIVDLVGRKDSVVAQLSGGLRRRLSLACALVHRPPVLFLDEPTTGLDPASRNDLWEVIQELVADGTTVLLTTQYLEEADRLADLIAVIDGGKKIAEGTSPELKATMGTTIVEVTMADHRAAAQARGLLDRVGSVELDGDGRTLRVNIGDGARGVLDVAGILQGADLVPDAFTVREPTLDDVFLELTGHRTDEPTGTPPDPPDQTAVPSLTEEGAA
jgi:ABC-type multidrug transport system ATPase subunit